MHEGNYDYAKYLWTRNGKEKNCKLIFERFLVMQVTS